MALYDSVNGVARKIVKMYDEVGGVAREVTKAYSCVDGVCRQYFSRGQSESEVIFNENNFSKRHRT